MHFTSLTSKQKRAYSAIESYIKQHGIPPTVREIGEIVGEKTPGAVQGILNRLEQKGVIKRQVGMARSIQLVSSEDNLYENPVYIPEIKKVSRRNIDNLLSIYNIVKYQPFPPSLLESGKSYLLINCPDDSVSQSDIKEGDLLLVDINPEPVDGDILMLLYENHVLVRRYYKGSEPETMVLKADSNLLGREVFSTDEIRIVGKLIGKFSRL